MVSVDSVLNIVDKISEYSGRIFSYLILPLSFIIGWEVLLRYVFNSATIWVHELSIHINGIYIVIGGAYVLLYNEHIRMDMFIAKLSPKQQAVVDIIVSLLFFFIFAGVIFWLSIEQAWALTLKGATTGSPWNSPIWLVRWGLSLATALLLLQGLANFTRQIRFLITGKGHG